MHPDTEAAIHYLKETSDEIGQATARLPSGDAHPLATTARKLIDAMISALKGDN